MHPSYDGDEKFVLKKGVRALCLERYHTKAHLAIFFKRMGDCDVTAILLKI